MRKIIGDMSWPNGPVIPEIYDYWMVYQDGDMHPCPYVKYKLSEEETKIINIVVDNTIDIPTEAIINYTHTHFGPWEQVYKNPQRSINVISKDRIKEYIRNEDAQKKLIDFIKNKTTKHKNLGFSKKLTPPRYFN